ncbi:MAG: amidohydrolase family protein [Planctomycetes bacterium]|nr:amidohydrolase family protein [Planctomycetota bacterium]
MSETDTSRTRAPAAVLEATRAGEGPAAAPGPAFLPRRVPVDVDRSRIAENVLTIFYRGKLASAERLYLNYAYNRTGAEDLRETEPEIEMSRRPDEYWEAHVPVPAPGDSHNLLFAFRSSRREWDDNLGRKWKFYIDLFRVPEVVDAHVHAHTAKYLLPVQARMETYFVDRALACTPDPEVIRENGNLRGVYFCAPPAEEDVKRVAGALDAGFLGIKFHPSADRFRVDEPPMHKFMDLAIERNVPLQFHTAADSYAHPKMILKLALKFPRAKIHMVHMGMHISWGRHGHEDAVRVAKQAPNLYLGMSWAEFNWVERAITQLGVERMLFESDAPIGITPEDDRRHDYRVYFNNMQQLNLSLTQLARLVAGNATALYGI